MIEFRFFFFFSLHDLGLFLTLTSKGVAFKSHLEKGKKNSSMGKVHVFIVHELLHAKNFVIELTLVDNSNKNV